MKLDQLVAPFCTCCPWEAREPCNVGLFFAALNRCPKCNRPTDALPVAGAEQRCPCGQMNAADCAGECRKQRAGPDGTP